MATAFESDFILSLQFIEVPGVSKWSMKKFFSRLGVKFKKESTRSLSEFEISQIMILLMSGSLSLEVTISLNKALRFKSDKLISKLKFGRSAI